MQEVRWCRRLVLTTRDPEFYERLNGEKWRRVTAPSEAATENVVRDGKGKGENGTTNLVPVEMTVMAITRDNKVLYASG